MENDKYWMGFWIGISILVIILAISLTKIHNTKLLAMADKGYCTYPVIGSSEWAWQSCK